MTKLALDGIGSLQQQICRGLREAIGSGHLAPNTRLTPSRIFAEEHGVSRNTVVAAYEQLSAEGYLETRRGAGTYVVQLDSAPIEAPKKSMDAPLRWSNVMQRINDELPAAMLLRQPRQRRRYDFLYGEPSYSDLPLDRWSRIIGRCARELNERQLGYGHVAGLQTLREAIASYLGRSRGVVCEPEQVFIVQGTQDAIDLAVRAFINPGDTAVLEEPRYRGFVRCLLAGGAKILSVPVDDEGLLADNLSSISQAKMAFVTPSHQFPFGSVMSLARRQQLLSWAKAHGTVILEDDYDGEFRYVGRPIPSLQSLDDAGLVVYMGTASKMLFPSLRLGWMVVPRQMVGNFEKLRSLSDSSGTILEQLAFATFIREGHLERHIHRVRRAHQERRQVLLETLHKELGDAAQVSGTDAGIHVLVRLINISNQRTEQIVQRASEENVGVYSSRIFYAEPPEHAELLLGYASLTPQQIRSGVRRLAKVVREF